MHAGESLVCRRTVCCLGQNNIIPKRTGQKWHNSILMQNKAREGIHYLQLFDFIYDLSPVSSQRLSPHLLCSMVNFRYKMLSHTLYEDFDLLNWRAHCHWNVFIKLHRYANTAARIMLGRLFFGHYSWSTLGRSGGIRTHIAGSELSLIQKLHL